MESKKGKGYIPFVARTAALAKALGISDGAFYCSKSSQSAAELKKLSQANRQLHSAFVAIVGPKVEAGDVENYLQMRFRSKHDRQLAVQQLSVHLIYRHQLASIYDIGTRGEFQICVPLGLL